MRGVAGYAHGSASVRQRHNAQPRPRSRQLAVCMGSVRGGHGRHWGDGATGERRRITGAATLFRVPNSVVGAVGPGFHHLGNVTVNSLLDPNQCAF